MRIHTLSAGLLLVISTIAGAVELFPIPDNVQQSAAPRPPQELLDFRNDLLRSKLSCGDLGNLRDKLLDRIRSEPQNQNYYLNRVSIVTEVMTTGGCL